MGTTLNYWLGNNTSKDGRLTILVLEGARSPKALRLPGG